MVKKIKISYHEQSDDEIIGLTFFFEKKGLLLIMKKKKNNTLYHELHKTNILQRLMKRESDIYIERESFFFS